MSAVPGVRYWYDPAAATFDAPGYESLLYRDLSAAIARYAPQTGENYLDGYQAARYGTPVFAGDVTNSRDIRTIRRLAGAITNNGQFVIQYDDGDYFFNNITQYGSTSSPNWLGYANDQLSSGGLRTVMGEIGSGNFDPLTGRSLTRHIVDPDAMANSPGALDYAFNPAVVEGSPLAMGMGGYFSGTRSNVPHFWSGIRYMGNMQEARTFGALARAKFSRNATAAAPAPYGGLTWWQPLAGSRLQYCTAEGFGQTYNSAPPYENAPFNSNWSAGGEGSLMFAVDVDGRLAAEFDPARTRTSGGTMKNKELTWREQRVDVHHTARSGGAINTPTGRANELYDFNDVRYYQIANREENGWPTDVAVGAVAGFNGINLEELNGLCRVRNSQIDSFHSTVNIVLPTSYGDPNRLLLDFEDVWTTDTIFNGCLRINFNSINGNSIPWQRLRDNLAVASDVYFRMYRNGVKLNAVKASQFNAAIHFPTNSYIIRSL